MTEPRMELVQAVAVSGDERTRWCDGCLTSAGFEAGVFAMLPSGLQLLATFQGCDRCDPDGTLLCFYCPARVVGGAAFWLHIRDRHGTAGG
ncbi:hypothetical protein [Micromonospora costi]|uniref:Uncharacterized protein n=1 Tax=Micromonospora costi TaxID=1530042 RepID=A0A3B0AA74_9ACTN|nr:hypothetical protein [Micromonospora costi]RKN55957.1 hypothetical protein D7193_15335 [Micromonospora costi]